MVELLRSKRLWKRLAIGFGLVVAMLLIANGVLAWRAERRLQQQIFLIHSDGDPASIPELTPEPIPDDKNAAAILRKISPRLGEFADEHGKFFNTPVGKAYDAASERGELPNAEQIAAIRAIVGKYPDVADAVAAAAACEQYASRLDFSLNQQKFVEAIIEHQSEVRKAVRFLGWKIEIDLADGQVESAIGRGLQMLRLGRLYDNEPGMVSFLIGIAVRGIAAEHLYDALSAGALSDEIHTTLDGELARQDDPERLQRAIKTERAMGAGWFDALVDERQLYWARMVNWQLKNYQTGSLMMMDEQLKLAARPWHEVRKQFGEADSPTRSTEHGVIADLLMPAIRASFEANARSVALLRSLRIYNALRQFAERNGREAIGLGELDLPAAAMIDPYTGQPLKLKQTDDGWVIYSVMGNGTDDGGDFKELKDFGVAPRKLRSTE